MAKKKEKLVPVLFLNSIALKEGVFNKGEVRSIPQSLAKKLISEGEADPVKETRKAAGVPVGSIR